LEEADERSARLRTSSATTLKPLPSELARAASTAALRARKFVWKPITSITSTMPEILREASPIAPIASVTVLAVEPVAPCEPFPTASARARCASSADRLTVSVSSLTVAEV